MHCKYQFFINRNHIIMITEHETGQGTYCTIIDDVMITRRSIIDYTLLPNSLVDIIYEYGCERLYYSTEIYREKFKFSMNLGITNEYDFKENQLNIAPDEYYEQIM